MRAILLIFVVFLVREHFAYRYDCRRLRDCQNGGTCTDQGTCNCASGFTSDTCELPETPVACLTPDICENGGTCFQDNGVDTCVCPYGFLGNNCEIKQVDVACGGDSIEYIFNFPETFNGAVMLADSEALPSVCAFTSETANGITTYALKIQLDAPSDLAAFCGQEYVTMNTEQPGATLYNQTIRVQYSAIMVTQVDEVANITCIHQESNIDKFTEFSNINVDSIGNLNVINQDNTYSPVGFILLDAGLQPMSAAVELYIGDTFYLHFYLTDTSVFTNILIQSCTANNTDLVSPKKFEMFDQGCPTRSGMATSRRQEVRDRVEEGLTYPGKSMVIKAFKFLTSDKLGLVCTIKLCRDTDPSCNVPTEADCNAVMDAADAPAPTDPSPTATGGTGGATDPAATDPATDGTQGATDGTQPTGGATDAGTGGAEGTAGTDAAPSGTDAAGGETPAATDAAPSGTEGAADGIGADGTGEAVPAGGDTGTTDPAAPVVRKRRDAEDDARVVSKVLTVRGPRDYTSDASRGQLVSSSVDDCLDNSSIRSIMIVLGVVVCILFIACLVLAMCLIRRHQKRLEESPYAKSERFQIPRAHVNDAFREI